jgi:putative hemolysin
MADYMDKGLKRIGITISKPMLAIVCIIFGLTVIVFPNLLVWIVGLFLIIQGALLLTDIFEQERTATPVTTPNAAYCSQCGTRNIEEAVYCKNCGKTLKQVKQKKKA